MEVSVHLHARASLSPGKTPVSRRLGGCVGARPGLDGFRKEICSASCKLSRIYVALLAVNICFSIMQFRGHAVAQLRYKPEGRGFDSQWRKWNYSLTYFFQAHYGPDFNSACNRKWVPGIFPEGKGVRGAMLTILRPTCADCQNIWESQRPGNLWTCNRPEQGLFYLYLL